MILFIGNSQNTETDVIAHVFQNLKLTITENEDALNEVDTLKPKAVFVDGNWLANASSDFCDNLSEIGMGIPVVYLTEDSTFAMEAFKRNAFDCNQKPVSEERLTLTLQKLKRYHVGNLEEDRNVQVTVFERFSVIVDDQLINLQTSKSAEIFAYLLMNHRKNGVEKWRLIKALWPDKDSASSDINFRTNLSRLKQTLDSGKTGMSIKTLQGAYRLDIGNAKVDAFEMANYAKSTGHILEKDVVRIDELIYAFDGDIFQGFDYKWKSEFSESYKAYFELLTKKLCIYYMEAKDYLSAEAVISRSLALNPYNEDAQELRLELKQKMGKLMEAERYYKELYSMHMREFGREPNKRLKKYLK
jgi:two-component SAPR family response regulator